MSTYDAIAEWYDAWVGPGSLHNDAFFQAVEALMGNVAGLRICDLACGQGRVARHLAELGASVVGVDVSARLLDIARRYETDDSCAVEYRHADARTLDGFDKSEFDGVVCFMSLMDIADLEPTLRSVHHILRPGGWFVFAILHPCFNTPRSGELTTSDGLVRTTAGYFVEGHWRSDTRTGPPGKVGAYHRTLSTYLNALLATGFRLDAVREPVASRRQAELRPIWTEVPAVLLVRCTRSAAAVEVRAATWADVESLVQLLGRNNPDRHTARLRLQSDGRANYLLAVRGGIPVGHLLVHWRAGEATLEDLWVDPAARRQGAASALLGRARQLAEERSLACLRLAVGVDNVAARALYAAHGYRPTGDPERMLRGSFRDAAGIQRTWHERVVDLCLPIVTT